MTQTPAVKRIHPLRTLLAFILIVVSAPLLAGVRGRAVVTNPNPPPAKIEPLKCMPASIVAQPPVKQWIALKDSADLTVEVSGSGTVNAFWFKDDGTPVGSGLILSVSPTENTCYYALVSNDCQTVKSADTWVMISTPVLTENATASQLTITAGQSTTLQAGGGTGIGKLTYKWYSSDGAPAGTGKKCVVRPVVTTSYYYTIYNSTMESAPSNLVTITVR
jgi:hypothetical protein